MSSRGRRDELFGERTGVGGIRSGEGAFPPLDAAYKKKWAVDRRQLIMFEPNHLINNTH